MDYFSLSKVKQKCFQAEKKKERQKEEVKKFLFFMGSLGISSSHWGELTQLWWEAACFQC